MAISRGSSVEFLGSKQSLLAFITESILRAHHSRMTIVDLFAGTGAVSAAFKQLGYSVTANDHMTACTTMTAAKLLNSGPPAFRNVVSSMALRAPDDLSPYCRVLAHLNSLDPVAGFIQTSYSPASMERDGVARMYFTVENAGKIDAIRSEIDEWKPLLQDGEYALLVADLIRAASGVSNVAGTYGCYLKAWKQRARNPLVLWPSTFVTGQDCGHRLFSMDAESVASEVSASIFYADPPYTKRQYAAYYHVLETIARNDRPQLVGSTGLRDWQSQSSDFCYKTRALDALRRLLDKVRCEHFFLSYSEDGQMEHSSILGLLGEYGGVACTETLLRRYRSSAKAHKGPFVAERLYHLSMT